VLGVIPTYMRPPYLECTAACLADLAHLGYHVVRTDLDTMDWMLDLNRSKQYISSALEGESSNTHSYLVLAHDNLPDTVDVLAPYMIDLIRREGYRSVTVGQCLEDPPENWYRDLETGEPALPRGQEHIAPRL
jgi:peptidoglycan/xylan/chitin deacetylase (PgdA/CDA1 family)